MLSPNPSMGQKETSRVKSVRRTLLAIMRLVIGVGLLIYLAKSGFIRFSTLNHLLTRWPLTVAACALILLHITLISVRLSSLFPPQGLKLPLRTALRLTLVGLFFGTFLPGVAGGDAAKVFYATRENEGRRIQVATLLILDRAIGLFSLLTLPLLFALLFAQLIARVPTLQLLLIFSAAFASLLLVTLLACLLLQSFVHRLAGAIHFSRLRNFALRMVEMIGAYRQCPATLWSALGLSLLANLSIMGVIALALLAVNPASLSWRILLIVPIGQIANGLPLTPGGLGVGEAAFQTLFKLARLSGGAEAMLCWRIWTVLMSGFGLFLYLRGVGPCAVEAKGDFAAMGKAGHAEAAVSLSSRRSG